ncbi:DUF779 domain-containing protein [Algibacter lectus]|uniref:UDP-glucose 4-epimerase n=1 Tax=Algibacter lectus TaxID=221126 RepID=A0A090X779_9FLAO|nr:DUF779 domain-containing protein [Algibacter lectus]GAL65031.1 hypothetical protein JCM19300_2233 [Algibacter lectus]GAL82562.1 hypothetical protein JCM19274_2338 [Algibacter lectus]SFD71494.1 hypothetical protein SAMN04489722_11719 [Algibacter lectus]
MKRVEITKEAAVVVEALKAKHGELIFHQSGGCCDGSAPMIFEKDDMYLDESDILLGSVAGVNFYMNQDQFEYWKHTHLTVDVTEGRGASFSLEIPLGLRFLIHSRLFDEAEQAFFKTV